MTDVNYRKVNIYVDGGLLNIWEEIKKETMDFIYYFSIFNSWFPNLKRQSRSLIKSKGVHGLLRNKNLYEIFFPWEGGVIGLGIR